MKRRTQQTLWIGLAAAVALGAMVEVLPLADASTRLERLPAFGDGFTTREMPMADAERAVFGDARVYRRLVATREGSFVLTVIDGTRNRHAIHDPHYCFRGAGYQTLRETPVALPGGAGCRSDLARDGARRTFLWCFSDGVHRHASPVRVWAETALRRMTWGASGPAPVLVLVEALDHDRDPARLWNVVHDMRFL